MGHRINEPTSTGIAHRSSTGWFAVVDENGETVTDRLWGSCFRAAEWAAEKFGKPWPELHALGFTVRGGYGAAESDSPPSDATLDREGEHHG